VRGPSAAPLGTGLSDNFTQDSSLNAGLWQVNGPAGSAFGAVNCPSCTTVTIAPSFSSMGMEVAQANASNEVGTIQSVLSFAPPLTATARVEGAVSNGHPFVFAIVSSDATSGVQITGNLNPNDCSNETNCGSPTTCGNPANPSIAANQCYYGIYARVGSGGGSWPKSPYLDLTPSIGVVYTLQIAVDASGNAQFNVSAAGLVLGQSTLHVGTGPFYIVVAQSEGAPVPGPGPNQAYWLSVSLTPTAKLTGPPPSGSSSGLSSLEWSILILVVIALLVAVVLLAYRRRRGFTVTVLDSGTHSPVPGAGVSADGPENLSGSTGRDGRVAFGGVKGGDYSVRANAVGFAPSVPATVAVKKATQHTVRLDRAVPPGAPPAVGGGGPADGSNVSPPAPTAVVVSPTPSAPAATPTGPAPSAPLPPGIEGTEGWGGERIREIVRTFQAKGAISPQTALTAEELGLSRIFVRIMKRRRGRTRVFVEVNGRYYLDEKALQEMK